MRRLLTGECCKDNIFDLVDPLQFLETAFEAEVVKALTCLMPEYSCGVFTGTFVLEGERRTADLALIHKSLSHWFVVEVELAGHSLDQHVLPQVRCFRYGEPDQSCVSSLTRAFNFFRPEDAAQLLAHVPRFVAVVGNVPNPEWTRALLAVEAQYLNVSVYEHRASGRVAYELEGRLVARVESLGFALFSATDNSLRLPKRCGLPTGAIQIIDQFGIPAQWTVREAEGTDVLWVTKDRGPALLPHNRHIQILRTYDGRLSLVPPR